MKLAGKVALVTGAQQGIGAAIAPGAGRGGGRRGAHLARRPAAAPKRSRAMPARPAGAPSSFRADVARLADIEAMVAETVRGARRARHPGQQCRRLSARAVPRDARKRLGLCARHQPQGRLLRRHRRRQGADRGRQGRRLDHQPLLAVGPRRGARRALQREQGRRRVDDARHGARARALQHPRQCHRARHDRHRPAALRQHRRRADRDRARHHPARRQAADARPDRAHRRVPRLRGLGRHTGQVLHVNGGAYMP